MITNSSLEVFIFSISDTYSNGFNINYLELLSFLAIISSILVINSKNPIVSVLFLISLFLFISIYLVMIGLTFIGISYLLVYIGAISMLFLFILMLIDIRISELHVDTNNSLFLAFVVGVVFYIILNYIIPFNINAVLASDINYVTFNLWDTYLVENYDIISIGNLLYSNFSIWLIMASLILLLAMVGAIIINIKKN